MEEKLKGLHTDTTRISEFSDRNIQELEHDFLCDVWNDVSGSLYFNEMYQIFSKEREKRNLEKLPQLFSTI
jgi:hypothetical protein